MMPLNNTARAWFAWDRRRNRGYVANFVYTVLRYYSGRSRPFFVERVLVVSTQDNRGKWHAYFIVRGRACSTCVLCNLRKSRPLYDDCSIEVQWNRNDGGGADGAG